MSTESKCRNCSTPIRVVDMSYAEVVRDKQRARWNFYGGWVCSEHCDRKAILDIESSMPGAGKATYVNPRMLQNWDQ